MRTKLKSPEYFENYNTLNNEDIEFYEDGLKSGATKEDRIPAVNRQIFTTSIHTVIAKYSAGAAIQEIQNDFLKVIDNLKAGWQSDTPNIQFDDYILMLWMLSLGILLDISEDDYKKIITVLDDSNHKDYIYDIIISSKLSGRNIDSNIYYPNEFGVLKDLYDKKNIAALKDYLNDSWYKKMKPAYWYDNDKNKNDVSLGTGALKAVLL
ncbi:PoNe immunity protein domain-containing protein [Chryseobacterium sp. CCNWLW24]